MKRSIPVSLKVDPSTKSDLRAYMLLCSLAGQAVTEWTAAEAMKDPEKVAQTTELAKENFPSLLKLIHGLARMVNGELEG